MKTIQPPSFQLPGQPDDNGDGKDAAANMIRHKLDAIYSREPDALSEAEESARPGVHSKHQEFMRGLSTSGKPFAQIQTEWHDYYQSLPDSEKHEVWNEFYSAQESVKPQYAVVGNQPKMVDKSTEPKYGEFGVAEVLGQGKKSARELKREIREKVRVRGKLSRKQNIKSLAFGLSMGMLTIVIFLFSFFNERVIAPFITPSKNVGDTPIIGTTATAGDKDALIIPKINVELPVNYKVETIDEDDIQKGLESGVVHYATTSKPGEKGNGAIFGHSSNNILNRGDYKFAFVLLKRLRKDDMFYIDKGGVRYAYKVFKTEIVSPREVSVLHDVPGKTSTMALITCDPPGTALKRLVVWGEQVSPDPIRNDKSTALQTDDTPVELAGDAPSLWSRIWPF